MTTPSHAKQAAYVLLLTNDEAGLTGFPGTLLPNGRVLVRDLPFERLRGICPGEIVVIPSIDSDLRVRRVRAIGTRAQRATEDSPTVLAVIRLAHRVADVPLPDSVSTREALDALRERFDGDIGAGLAAAGMSATLVAPGDESAARIRRVECADPLVHVGPLNDLSLCDWLGIFCDD